jgi:hypothetical protein
MGNGPVSFVREEVLFGGTVCKLASKAVWFVRFADSCTVSVGIFMRSSFGDCATCTGGTRPFAPIAVQGGWGRGTVPFLNKTARIREDSGRLLLLIMSVA